MANLEFLNSADVKVFPTAYRKNVSTTNANGTATTTTYNPEAKLNTEFNLTSMASRTASNESFVLSYGNDVMTVSMKGYWFELTDIKSKCGAPLWATIYIKELNTTSDENKFNLPTLYSLKDGTTSLDNLDDTDGSFYGIKFSNAAPTSESGKYSLQLLDAEGKVPAASYLRVSSEYVQDAGDASDLAHSILTKLTTNTVSANTVSAENVSAANTVSANTVSANTVSAENVSATSSFTYSGISNVPNNNSNLSFGCWVGDTTPYKFDKLMFMKNSISVSVPITSTSTITALSFNASSDMRLKENIIPLERADGILDLPLYEFDYRNGSGHSIGCLAQELREMVPELVSEDSEGYLSVKESKLVYYLLLEVRALRDELRELKEGK